MLKTAAATFIADAVRKQTGASSAGPIATSLIGTGASLLLTRGRRPFGVVLLAAGGYLLWREKRAEAGLTRPTASAPAPRPVPPAATASAG